MQRYRLRTLSALTLSTSLILAPAAVAQTAPLLRDAPAGNLSVTPPAHARNIRKVGLNFASLETVDQGDMIEFRLGGIVYTGVVLEQIPRIDGRSVLGQIQGLDHSSFGIAVSGDAAAGWFDIPGRGTFRLRYGGPDGLHYVHEIDGALTLPCAGTFKNPGGAKANVAKGGNDPDFLNVLESLLNGDTEEGEAGAASGAACGLPDFDYFDVAIFYTDDARVAAGGASAIRAECAAAVDRQWLSYSNSLLSMIRPRLVHRSEVSYAETGDMEDDIDNFQGGSSGLSGTHTIREDVGADFAVLFTEDGGDFCGLATCEADEDDEAYCIVQWACAVDNLSFAHELGHIIGCDHDPDVGEGTGCFVSTGIGNYFWVPDETMWRHTVMSYSNNDSARIPFYSHPDVEYMNVATGSSSRDNVSVIFNRRNVCENFRLTRMDVWVDDDALPIQTGSFTFPYDTVNEGVNRILDEAGMSEIPVLYIKPGTYNETIILSKPMTIDACGGTVTIG